MPEQYQSALTGPQMDQALLDMANHTSERYAKGTANGAAVPSGTVGYHDNALYYKNLAANQAQTAINAAGSASNSATAASTSETNATTAAGTATSAATTATQQATRAQNAAERAEAIVGGQFVSYGQNQGLTSAQQAQARKNIMAGRSNLNLLDNSWFTVNQRRTTSGGTTETSAYVGPDRWRIFRTASWSVQGNALTLAWNGTGTAAGFLQYTGPERGNWIKGKTATLSAYINGTLYSKTFVIPAAGGSTGALAFGGGFNYIVNSDNETTQNRGVEVQFRTTSTANITIGPIKLELGGYSTLANDGPPNYAEELSKCQYYLKYFWFDQTGYVLQGLSSSSVNALFLNLNAFAPMHKTPTLSYTGSYRLRVGGQNYAVNSLELYQVFPPVTLLARTSGSFTAETTAILTAIDGNQYIALSAEP